jgi:hypothetical protein
VNWLLHSCVVHMIGSEDRRLIQTKSIEICMSYFVKPPLFLHFIQDRMGHGTSYQCCRTAVRKSIMRLLTDNRLGKKHQLTQREIA